MSDLERLTTALAEQYRIERKLGAGGMATVYLGEDLRHQRRVAVKVLRPDLSAIVGAERFLNEIRVTANLQHPHILPLYDSGEADHLLYYVMPYVEGDTLRDRLNREKQLPIDEAVRLAREVAGALDYAHRQGVIHRDIKPENILLQDGTALVTDFGIALAVSQAGGSRLTETGLSLGTPFYMSPEQATGDRQLDARSDVYALGAVLYEMLSGDPPHTGSTAQAVIAAVVTETPRDIATRRRRLAPHIAEAVHRALEKLPADRFASAADFAKALEGPAATTGRFASAPSARRARWRWAPAPLLAAGLVVGLVAGRLLFHAAAPHETRTRLTFTGDASAPAVTRDGKWLAYIRGRCRSGGADCEGDLVVQELPRGAPSVVVAGARDMSQMIWSPDGASLLLTMRPASGEPGLYAVPRAGSLARKVADDAELFAFADNRTVAFTSRARRSVLLADVSTGDVRDSVAIGDGRWALNSLDWNPDNGLIAFGGIHGSTFYQGIADRRGKVLDSLSILGQGGWDTDGRHVMVFELGAQSVGRLVLIGVSRSGHFTGRPVEYLGGIRLDEWTGFSRTPTGYVIGDAGRTSDLWSFAVAGVARRLTHSSTWTFYPSMSPDGRTVAYVKQDAWGANVYTVPSAGGPERPVTADSGTRQLVRWLPDQQRLSAIVLASAGSGGIAQQIAELTTGRLRTLTLDPGLLVVGWLPDGKALAQLIDTRGLAVVDSAGRTLRHLPLADSLGGLVLAATPSPDGRAALVVVKRAQVTLAYAMQLADGSLRLIGAASAVDSERVTGARWASDGFVYFARAAGVSQPALWRLAERGGALQRHATLPVACDQNSLTLSRDARSGACIVNDDRPDLWLVERR
jgi:Tol biopolymer transport system component/tRNA A-37 threonylcarbamoyl transferase component Bud32